MLVRNHSRCNFERWCFDEICRVTFVREQRFDFAFQRFVSGTGLDEKRGTLIRVSFEDRMIKPFDFLPTFILHEPIISPASSRNNQTLARRQSRITVSFETFNNSATSSTERPAKKRSSTTRTLRGSTSASAVNASSSETKSGFR